MTNWSLTTRANDTSYLRRLEEQVDCGRGLLVCGGLTVAEKRPVAVFTFSKPYSRDLGLAMEQLAAKIIGIMPNGVRTNPHNPRQIIIMLRPGTKVQKLAAALHFKDKVVDWIMLNPEGSDTGRKRGHTSRPDTRDADRRQHRPAPPVTFKS